MKQRKQINWHTLVIAVLVTVLAWVCWIYISPKTNQAHLQRTLIDKQILLDHKLQELNQQKSNSTKLEEERLKLQQEKQELEKQLQAKKDAQVAYAANLEAETVQTSHIQPVQAAFAGSCSDWIAQAGISDIALVMALITVESGCNAYAVNSGSGACGVAQELPCGKSGCSLGDGACQVRWMNSYVINRYGSWSSAYETWLSRSPHWY